MFKVQYSHKIHDKARYPQSSFNLQKVFAFKGISYGSLEVTSKFLKTNKAYTWK